VEDTPPTVPKLYLDEDVDPKLAEFAEQTDFGQTGQPEE